MAAMMSGLGKHGREERNEDSVVPKVARAIPSTRILREGENYNYEDREGQWHNVVIKKRMGGGYQVHFIGFPNGFDHHLIDHD